MKLLDVKWSRFRFVTNHMVDVPNKTEFHPKGSLIFHNDTFPTFWNLFI